jgi:hypothetical protein
MRVWRRWMGRLIIDVMYFKHAYLYIADFDIPLKAGLLRENLYSNSM